MTAHVTNWYGCSAGAICAAFAAIGVSASWLREVSEIFSPQFLGVIREDYVCDFTRVWGVTDIAPLAEVLGKFVDTWEPGCSAWTFAELAEKRPESRLHISATNVSRGEPALFNVTTAPGMRIMDAICASSTIPFYFAPWIHPVTGDIYCDGSVIEQYPWNCIPNKGETLVVVCSDRDIVGRVVPPVPVTSLTEYFTRIVSLAHRRGGPMPKFWIAVNNKNIYSVDFHITKEDIAAAFEDGINSAKGWMAFRAVMLDSPPETVGNPPSSVHRRTSSAFHSLLGIMSDNPECRIPTLQKAPLLDPHSGRRQSGRRWSL
jgi:predicted acylesterase/phospholipase RssA